MSHPRLILHVGGAKCGSSALQSTFSAQPRLTAPGTSDVVYAALHARQGLVHGETLAAMARSQSFGYVTSATVQDLRDMERPFRDRALADLRGLLANHDHVVLSNESWLPRCDLMADMGLLEDLGEAFSVFAVVRPQAEIINSGWWQWGAWLQKTLKLRAWARRRLPQCQWHHHLQTWQQHPACADVAVRLLSRDIVGDFLAAYGLIPDPGLPQCKTSNVSLPGEVLRLFQRHPDLRKGRAVIDFALAGFGLGDQPTPWVVDSDLAEEITAQSRADNEALCAMLPEDQAIRMRETPGWWSGTAYTDRPLETSQTQPAESGPAVEMQARLMHALDDVKGQLLFGPALPGDLALPLPAGADADQLDARNAALAEALFHAATALHRQNAGG
ncbi:hypothetical protein [Sedimentitalea sp.]|uniref:hypothetical protein n=1 Tax=Sedimentitalea sp. TaxID=2048915 RepID=UPI0032634E27